MKKLHTDFIEAHHEVTEDKYYEMLECLPPIRMAMGGFLVGEPVDFGAEGHMRYELYFMKDDKYWYGGLATTADFDLFAHPIPQYA